MKLNRFRIVAIVWAILLPFLVSSCGTEVDNDTGLRQSDTGDSPALSAPVDSIVIELAGADSRTAFDLLKSNHQVEYKSSVMGVFVTAIDSIENSAGAYWLYSVNDSMPLVACDKYVTKSGDMVKWHFRKATR